MISTEEITSSDLNHIVQVTTQGSPVQQKDVLSETQGGEINYNKPWRIIIRRTVTNGGGNN